MLSIFLLLSFSFSKESYERSLFGAPGTDEVHNEFVDGFEVLQRGLTHPKLNHVKNGKYSSSPIDENDYPWPGHNYGPSCTSDLLMEESNNIINKYKRINLTENEVHWHPAAAAQWYTTQDELNKADRVKIKFTFRQEHEHVLPAFIPPGELVTVEIPEIVAQKNELGFTFNVQTRDSGGMLSNRLPKMIIRDIRLRNKVNKIAIPYGGTMQFHYGGSDPVEIIVSGVILQPYFIYGQHSDEEWENDLSKRPGPYAFLDTGNLVHIVPSQFVRDTYRMNDCMHFWRSAIQISQTTAKDCDEYNNPRYGRIVHPCILKYDTWVPAGAAVAFVGGNFCHFPCDWISSTVNYNSASDNPWGTVHEIDHHHQRNWALTQESGEMSNNAVNLVIYAKQNLCSGSRLTSGWAKYSYASFELNDVESYGLQRYSTLLHFFGVDKFKEFVKADQENLWYPRNEFGNPGSEMLRASRVFNRNMRYHWNFHLTTDEVLNKEAGDTFAELNKLNLKPFHPVTTVYAVGNIVDGKAFITARPYRIETYEQTIDFVSTMVQRADKEKFGDFEFHSCSFEKGRESAWKETSKGVYRLTPKENMLEVEEVNVSYLDKTTNEIHVVICQFTTFYSSNSVAILTRYGGIPNTEDDLFKSYRYITQNLNENTSAFIIDTGYKKTDGIAQGDYSNADVNTWISILEGKLTPPETADYIFSCTGESQVAFYLSEEPLHGDPDLDEDKLTNFQPSTVLNYDSGNHSATLHLIKGKMYYFRHIVFPSKTGNRRGRGWIGFKVADSTNGFVNVPQSWFKFSDKELTEEERFNNQFVPDFERIYLMDKWNGPTFQKNKQTNWDVYKVPKGDCYINSNSGEGTATKEKTPTDVLTDSDATTEYRVKWWPENVALAFPHIFEIDMGSTNSFSSIRIGKTGNTGYYPMKNYLEIYLAPSNYTVLPQYENETAIPYSPSDYSINHNESLIWSGIFDTSTMETIELDKIVSGRYMMFKFINNSLRWKDGHPGRTDVSAIEVGNVIHAQKVYPMTNTKYIQKVNQWDETRSGIYYNGKGYTGYGKKKSVLQIRIPSGSSEFGIIGDYYPSMGTATVKMDGKEVGQIGESLFTSYDEKRLLRASRSYQTLLFFMNGIDPKKSHIFQIDVKTNSLTFAGFLCQKKLVDWSNDDGSYEAEYAKESLPKFKKINGLSAGAIAGIVIAVIAVLAAVAVAVFVMYKKELLCFNHDNNNSQNENTNENVSDI
ncbi:hypothetical protein M9Y10_006456 [Tritrichomonas musculus]|uniref:Peptidase M60 domain-containing protein n=1 Tax=Tritrichomonas musculus TaxID=1915356 RepID=A0ABR2JEQ4_9EUKA